MHSNSKLLFQKHGKEWFHSGINVLEIGPDNFPSAYASIVNDKSIQWDTLDIYQDSRLTYSSSNRYKFPIESNSYDIVLSGQVIEHVPKIWLWINELTRVCKVGGLVITINPISWPYHEAPVDCWRIFPAGMIALYEEASLEVIVSHWGSLEAKEYKRHIPGRSLESVSRIGQITYRILGSLGLPVERAYDAITIGKKIEEGSVHIQ